MGFCHLSTNCNKNSDVRIEDNLLKNVSREFLYWFSGFTDAEGNFLITIDRQYVRFRFKIVLHIDDVEVLNTIKSNLNVGTVTLESSRNRCSYIVQDYGEIIKSGVPLGRIGAPEDIAGTAIYLSSKAGAFTNGATIVVDGGSLVRSSL